KGKKSKTAAAAAVAATAAAGKGKKSKTAAATAVAATAAAGKGKKSKTAAAAAVAATAAAGKGKKSKTAAAAAVAATAAAGKAKKSKTAAPAVATAAATAAAAAAAATAAEAAVAEAYREVESAVGYLHATSQINASQRDAVLAILCGDRAVQLVQGPPGTGKTTVISHTVALWQRLVVPVLPPLSGPGRTVEALACVARSNVAAKNIALALLKRGLGPGDFRLVVSEEYHFEWHEEQYRGQLQTVVITSNTLRGKDVTRMLAGVRIFVTTVSMLSSPKFRSAALFGKELTRLLVDEASQIYVGELMLPLHQYGKHLRSLSLFGDDVQLPPYGSEWDGAQVQSVFDHLTPPASRAIVRLRSQPNAFMVGPELTPPHGSRGTSATTGAGGDDDGAHRIMLSVSYRLPQQLCSFISTALYGGLLDSGRVPCIPNGRCARPGIRWVDVRGKEENTGSSSFRNPQEAEEVVRLVKSEFMISSSSWTVITGYDLQRTLLEKQLNKHLRGGVANGGAAAAVDNRTSGDRVYNIDTFQGREDEVVIASLVRSGTSLGFMKDDRRVNVMLTRCTHQLLIVGSLNLALANPHTLIGRMAQYCSTVGLVECRTT
ncbi:hypothetical protein Vretimale_18173, partial [Volvox reticuliferus]